MVSAPNVMLNVLLVSQDRTPAYLVNLLNIDTTSLV